MRSLFILSLPRSLSSQVHALCCSALGLQSPAWTSAGEIMNLERSVLCAGRGALGLKYTVPEHSHAFGPVTAFLSAAVAPQGFCYKDVVHPFVVSQWLRANPGVAVLKIAPNVPHVAMAMMRKNWLYPTVATRQGGGMEERMMAGLLRATEALSSVPGETVAYDDLIFDFAPLGRALRRLYPEAAIGPLTMEADFAGYRAEVLARWGDSEYRALEQIDRVMRSVAA